MLPVDKVPHALPLQLEPLTVQFTAPPSLVVGVRDSVCVTVNPALCRVTATEADVEDEAIVKVRLTDRLCAGMLESFAVKVSGTLLAVTVGVPEIAPVVALNERPAGSVPLVSDQE